jgi:transposase
MDKRSPSNDNAAPFSTGARDWKEGRRLRALELLAQGYRPSTVARVLGVSPGAVSQWIKRAKHGGPVALFRRRRRGRAARLDAEQLNELRAVLGRLAGPLSTREIAVIIREKWGVSYSRAHVSRILKTLGLSMPLPRRAAHAEV